MCNVVHVFNLIVINGLKEIHELTAEVRNAMKFDCEMIG